MLPPKAGLCVRSDSAGGGVSGALSGVSGVRCQVSGVSGALPGVSRTEESLEYSRIFCQGTIMDVNKLQADSSEEEMMEFVADYEKYKFPYNITYSEQIKGFSKTKEYSINF